MPVWLTSMAYPMAGNLPIPSPLDSNLTQNGLALATFGQHAGPEAGPATAFRHRTDGNRARTGPGQPADGRDFPPDHLPGGGLRLALSRSAFLPDPEAEVHGRAEVRAIEEGNLFAMRQIVEPSAPPAAT